MMNKARDVILQLYKEDKITKDEVDILLDAIVGEDCCYNPLTYKSYIDWTYRPEEQPSWTYKTEDHLLRKINKLDDNK